MDHPCRHHVEGSAGRGQLLDARGVGRAHPGEHHLRMAHQLVEHATGMGSPRSHLGHGQVGQQERQPQQRYDREPGLDRPLARRPGRDRPSIQDPPTDEQRECTLGQQAAATGNRRRISSSPGQGWPQDSYTRR